MGSSTSRDALAQLSNAQIATGFLDESIGAMHGLQSALDPQAFDRAVLMLARADAIWLLGSRRLFPIAAYLDYAFRHTDKRVGLISGLGGMQEGEARSIRRDDVLVAISSAPHAAEVLAIVDDARTRGAGLIAISDTRLGRSPGPADCYLMVHDSSRFGFRSLAGTMALAQCLFTALAYRLGLGEAPGLETNS